MSFLVGDKDQLTLLGEVLAFIDSSEFDETTSTSTFSDDVVTVQVDESSSKDEPSRRTASTKTKKRKRRNLSSSTRLQQSKKAELLFLRKRVLELDDQLQRLQRRNKRQRTLFPQHKFTLEAKTPLAALVDANFHARLQAEQTNRHLKALLADQLQASEALCAFLQNQVIRQEADFMAIQPIPMEFKLDGALLDSEWLAQIEPSTLPAY